MLFGPRTGVIVAVQPIEIYGTRMLDIVYRLDDEASNRSARMGRETLDGELGPGSRVIVHLLMNVATRIEVDTH